MSQLIQAEIIEQLSRLPDEKQKQVLDYTRLLTGLKPIGVPGETMLQFAGLIPSDELERMEQAIAEACGQVDTLDVEVW